MEMLDKIASTVAELRSREWGVVLVSSGAVGCGRMILRDAKSHLVTNVADSIPSLEDKQALAALGQGKLMAAWETAMNAHKLHAAHVLFGRADIGDEARYANAHGTLNAILSLGAVPVVNENDTVAAEELKVGDNDNLSALVASMCCASLLVLLTDVDGLYTANPNTDPTATRIPIVRNVAKLEVSTDGVGSSLGTGGMATKIEAARVATTAGTPTVVLLAADMPKILDFSDAADEVTVVSGRRAKGGRGVMRGVPHDFPPNIDGIPIAPLDGADGGVTCASMTSSSSEDVDVLAAWKRASKDAGTVFLPRRRAEHQRKRWVLAAQTMGKVVIDEEQASRMRAGETIRASGVISAEGNWDKGDVVKFETEADGEIGRGMMEVGAEMIRDVIDNDEGVPDDVHVAQPTPSEAEITSSETLVPYCL